jgi:hypothetical protein
MYYQNMRQAMLQRAKALKCTFDKEKINGSVLLNLMESLIHKGMSFKPSLMSEA